jgi:hypothetical protein
MRIGDSLPDAPQYSGRIDDDEIADAPWPILGWINLHAVLGRQPNVLNVPPPGFNVLDEKMHHKVIGVFSHVEVLQEKAELPW